MSKSTDHEGCFSSQLTPVNSSQLLRGLFSVAELAVSGMFLHVGEPLLSNEAFIKPMVVFSSLLQIDNATVTATGMRLCLQENEYEATRQRKSACGGCAKVINVSPRAPLLPSRHFIRLLRPSHDVSSSSWFVRSNKTRLCVSLSQFFKATTLTPLS
jgi:hypothetical protein